MKLKLFCKPEYYDKHLQDLKDGNFEISETDAEFYVVERGYHFENILGKYNEEYCVLKPSEILYFESFGPNVFAVTLDKKFQIKERLYEVEGMFNQKGFLRVHKSYVINVNQIKSIRSTFNMKFILKMKNQSSIDVTRSYYLQFKDYFRL